MHDTAYLLGQRFFETYLGDDPATLLEIGSYNVNGTLRDFTRPDWFWVGVDQDQGPGVDVRVRGGQPLPFEDSSFDVVLSTSVFEHDPFFWETFLDMARLVKPDGFIYINAPTNGPYHRYPEDCWRFYPDAGVALEAWARRRGHEITLLESFVAPRISDSWNDFAAIYTRGRGARTPPLGIAASANGTNVRRPNSKEVGFLTSKTEDMLLLESARRRIAHLEDVRLGLFRRIRQLEASLAPDRADLLPIIPVQPPFIGHLDVCTPDRVSGWAMSTSSLDDKLRITVMRDGQVIVAGSAQDFRPDVKNAGHGDGGFGFSFPLDKTEPPPKLIVVLVSTSEGEFELGRWGKGKRP